MFLQIDKQKGQSDEEFQLVKVEPLDDKGLLQLENKYLTGNDKKCWWSLFRNYVIYLDRYETVKYAYL